MKYCWVAVLILVSCGGDKDLVVGTLSWSFNYKNWTNSGALDDLRSCTNQPSVTTAVAYEKITDVDVELVDPRGEVPGLHKQVACTRGEGSQTFEIVGVTAQTYSATLTAFDAEGDVHYQLENLSIDLGNKGHRDIQLPTVVGELHFFPRFSGITFPNCPTGVSQIRYEFYEVVNSVRGDLVQAGIQSQCDLGQVDQLLLRTIPSAPTAGPLGGFVPTPYIMVLRAQNDLGDTLYCRVANRGVNPGDENLNQDETLQPGDCPGF